ncbi:aspartate--tRNA ligase, chloroplastic/mitochondrial [Trifolium repens]|nr:aspartate--tRNA ligase, chloroplastic/mitochondrial [Trifolium repens]
MKKIGMNVTIVAANEVQVLNSVNAKLPFLVTTADDARDSLKEEIRLRYRCLDLRRQQMRSNNYSYNYSRRSAWFCGD